MNGAIVRHGLCLAGSLEAEKAHAARARLVALDEALRLERVQQVGDGLRRLDVELLGDLADARLVRVLREKVYQVVIDPPFELREWLRHGPPSAFEVALPKR